MEPSKLEITTKDWVLRLKNVEIRKEVVNRIVMNFFVAKGYQEAVEEFQKESGSEPDVDLASFTNRMAVVKARELEIFEHAIELNGVNPEMPETNSLLIQQRMIELVREDRTNEALAFAQNELLENKTRRVWTNWKNLFPYSLLMIPLPARLKSFLTTRTGLRQLAK